MTATAGVTVQPRRSVLSTAAAAPGWPTREPNAAFSTRRLSTNIVARMAVRIPMKPRVQGLMMKKPRTRNTANTPKNTASRIHGSSGSFGLVIVYA